MTKFLSNIGLEELVSKIKQALSGKQDTIDSSHKLSADLISDGTTNKTYTAIEQTKLSGIATGAEVNVLANWNETNSSSDAYILNKPSIPDDSNLVHKTGNETINGDKTFTGNITGTSINGDLWGGVYSSWAEIGCGVIVPPVDGNIGTLTLGSMHDGSLQLDAQLIVGNPEGNPDGETLEEQATGGWNQIYNSVTETTLQDELDIKSNKIPIVSHGTSDTTFTLTPNVYHIWGEVSTLTLTLGEEENGYLSEYMFEFQSGNTATVLTLPNTVEFPSTPTIEANKRYLVSIVSNIALIVGV